MNEDGIVEYEYFSNNELSTYVTQLQGRSVFAGAGSVQHLLTKHKTKINSTPGLGYSETEKETYITAQLIH